MAETQKSRKSGDPAFSSGGKDVADTGSTGFKTGSKRGITNRKEFFARSNVETRGWWSVEPRLGRVAHGVAYRVDRLKAIGNGQVPGVVRAAWEILNDHLEDGN